MDTTTEIHRTMRIEAPRERVFALLTDLERLSSWMPMQAFDPRLGGRYVYEVGEWVASGEIVEFDPPSRLVYTWDWENEPMGGATVVEFDLGEDGDATILTLRHRGLPGPELIESHARGWDHVLARLVVVGAGGDPGPADVLGAVFGEG